MSKSQRKIFTPTSLTEQLIDGLMHDKGLTVSDFVNDAILKSFTPKNKSLRLETNSLLDKLSRHRDISLQDLKGALSRCVASLKDNPIESPDALESIMQYFINPLNNVKRYDYIQITTTDQDEQLRKLKAILGSLDDNIQIGNHELGENARYVFRYWLKLREYSEVYVALATIIDCESCYLELSVFETLCLIMSLDEAVQASTIHACTEHFPINLTLKQQYKGYQHEIVVYYTDNAYASLSDDAGFENMPQDIISFYQETFDLGVFERVTEEDVERIKQLERKGRMLFQRLKKSNSCIESETVS